MVSITYGYEKDIHYVDIDDNNSDLNIQDKYI